MLNIRNRQLAVLGLFAAAAICMGGCAKKEAQTTSQELPIEIGLWSQAGTTRYCASQQLLPMDGEVPVDTVCPDNAPFESVDGCSMTRSGDAYVIDCTMVLTFGECQVMIDMQGAVVVADRRHYTVDGTITVTAAPGGCWLEMGGEYEGCVQVHEEYTWIGPLQDGDCESAKAAYGADDLLRDPGALLAIKARQLMLAHDIDPAFF